MSALDGNALIDAWRNLDETHVAYQPALPLPPADLDTRDTAPWLEPVRFFGEPIRFAADRPLPSNCQHALASALEDVTKDVRAVPSTHRQQLVDTPAARVPSPTGVVTDRDAGCQGVPPIAKTL